MDHIGDYQPKVGEKFIYLGYRDTLDEKLKITEQSGELVVVKENRGGMYPLGISISNSSNYYVSSWELGFLQTPKKLTDWM